MKFLPLFIFTLLIMLMVGCDKESEIDRLSFKKFEPIELTKDFESISPKEDHDYWIIFSSFYMPYDHIPPERFTYFQVGDTSHLSSIISSIEKDWNMISESLTESCNYKHCQVCDYRDCPGFLATADGDLVQIIGDHANLFSFLGSIDSKGDAILWTLYNEYSIGKNVESGSIRRVEDGFQIIALKAHPCVTRVWRYLLHVHLDGQIDILLEDVYKKGHGDGDDC